MAHQGQVDKAGNPYFLHPYWMAENLRVWGAPDQFVTVAWLHDVFEDTEASLDSFRPSPELSRPSCTLRPQEVQALQAITRHDGETYQQYIDRVAKDLIACTVKVVDLCDNLRAERVGVLSQPRRTTYRRAMARLLPEMMDGLGRYNYGRFLRKQIKRQVREVMK